MIYSVQDSLLNIRSNNVAGVEDICGGIVKDNILCKKSTRCRYNVLTDTQKMKNNQYQQNWYTLLVFAYDK